MVRPLGAFAVIGAITAVTSASAGTTTTPRFSFSEPVVTPGDEVALRLTRRPQPFKRPLRVYLVPERAANVSSRFDQRLVLVGSITRTTTATRFTVPPLDPGVYSVAHWCSGCKLSVLRRPLLRIEPPSSGEACAVTKPNGRRLRGAKPSP